MDVQKIIVAPDSFKGTLSSVDACKIISKGIENILGERVEIVELPIADGGEGTVEIMHHAVGGQIIKKEVTGPQWKNVEAEYLWIQETKTAVIEMAEASGLCLVKADKNPLFTTTYGTGELILDALNKGCTNMLVGIGGSATNDGGSGMATALGAKFLNENNETIPCHGSGLQHLVTIDTESMDKRLTECDIKVACDVDNPLCGPQGASYIYGPQKGADNKMVAQLDRNLLKYGTILEKSTGKNILQLPGAGAAGGLGAGLVGLCNAKLVSGIDLVLETVNFKEHLNNADLVITGEGQIDGQSLHGKVPIGIGRIAKENNIPVIVIAGSVGENIDKVYQCGITSIFSINRKPEDFEIAKYKSRENLQATTESIIRLLSI
jgi:glycerate kinase